MTEEDKRVFKEVNAHSYLGSEVLITLKGDQRDYPSIYGTVRGVNNEVKLLIPAKVDNKQVQRSIVNISDIAKCTSLPEEWDQNEMGPAQYTAEQSMLPVERP